MRIATVCLYDNEIICLPWEKVDDPIVWSHEITEIEASKLLPSFCGILIFGDSPRRCGHISCNIHQILVSEEWVWTPPHMFASIAFGCGIELKDGWLTLNVDQCWCLLKNASNSRTRPKPAKRDP
ncbi:MAG: hypothetical protein ACTSV2_08510 [Candidatus Thorarchaeota archaeon]